jgi:squalene cyclase
MHHIDLESAFRDACRQLLAERNREGSWTGCLATSALSTAVAIVALKKANDPSDNERISAGFEWLCKHINADGGFGDTRESLSNMSTTLLCYAAVSYCGTGDNRETTLSAIENWLSQKGLNLHPSAITKSILDFYGRDYTFSVPILSMLVVCGVIPESSASGIPALPFEFTLLPQKFYRFVNLRVVSYALPALIGVGIYLHRSRRKGFPGYRMIRERFVRPAIDKLRGLVPASGGFLEAIPLTGFVVMCLIAAGESKNEIIVKGLEFLRKQQREEGGWPIDTDLSTWVTTLSIKALGTYIHQLMPESEINLLRRHLLSLQYKTTHPFNGAAPGGWGWTNYSGSVPDADDTPGAILALLEIYRASKEERTAIENGCRWLIDIQNKDGGFPTFCKGWGKLPFDRSCADLTGHALLALAKTNELLHENLSSDLKASINRSIRMAMRYLGKNQSENGSWLPLWFGNQLTRDNTNPVYGSAKVCIYLSECLAMQHLDAGIIRQLGQMGRKAQNFLVSRQNSDGSWGGDKGIPGTVEETSLAVCALAHENKEVCLNAIRWIKQNEKNNPAPIGLYFALLWYDEKLYPVIYKTEAMRRLQQKNVNSLSK